VQTLTPGCRPPGIEIVNRQSNNSSHHAAVPSHRNETRGVVSAKHPSKKPLMDSDGRVDEQIPTFV
jgi:hypothetical protein